jgi:hypothetical protein
LSDRERQLFGGTVRTAALIYHFSAAETSLLSAFHASVSLSIEPPPSLSLSKESPEKLMSKNFKLDLIPAIVSEASKNRAMRVPPKECLLEEY